MRINIEHTRDGLAVSVSEDGDLGALHSQVVVEVDNLFTFDVGFDPGDGGSANGYTMTLSAPWSQPDQPVWEHSEGTDWDEVGEEEE